jgi:hypothetical protein
LRNVCLEEKYFSTIKKEKCRHPKELVSIVTVDVCGEKAMCDSALSERRVALSPITDSVDSPPVPPNIPKTFHLILNSVWSNQWGMAQNQNPKGPWLNKE